MLTKVGEQNAVAKCKEEDIVRDTIPSRNQGKYFIASVAAAAVLHDSRLKE